MNPLNSIKGVWILGILLAFILAVAVNLAAGASWLNFQMLEFWRWTHIIAGITWIGLLYYFNFVQMPAVAAAGADSGGPGPAAINQYVAPRALLWFRWAAVVTWVSGAIYLSMIQQFANAFSLGFAGGFDASYGLPMGIGVWLGTIMLINVWVLIWPNQKKVLGLVEASDEAKAKAKKIATMASRTNVVLSIPMLMFMVAARHGLVF
ncbi:urate hydroxylase PuuD [Natronospira bacteriovora]|uniref:Urate hydroxylase PuuD n=1 Tax=Natronospira bacteriovora TaxID=3069753 RepID=A0ABU0W5W9_9GAMM|nr:urate hydroxylase PuuD [Natronospira sp. AB-CW4]MDQ2069362.1 urate hydroxylase PuuD [Natronospira sp. AB-CW4]